MIEATYVTAVYAALLALLFFTLSVRVLRLRRELEIAVGDGGHPKMLRAMRAQANFIEYTPISLVLVLLLEMQGVHYALIHTLCLYLLFGRFAHAYGISRTPENYKYRVFGMAMTFATLVGSAFGLIFVYAWSVIV